MLSTSSFGFLIDDAQQNPKFTESKFLVSNRLLEISKNLDTVKTFLFYGGK